jgi:parvulin-like peptidyl-prolyl isomerase
MPAESRPKTGKAPSPAPRSTREALRLRGPSRRQLSRHQREARQRRALLIGGAALLALIIGVLGFGYWRENYARGQETVATLFGERVTADQLLQDVRPRLTSVDRRIALYQANGLSQQATQLQAQRQRLPETVLNEMVEDQVVRREAARRGIVVAPSEVDDRLRQLVAQSDQANQPQPTSTPAPTTAPGAEPTATAAGTPTPQATPTPLPTLTEDRYGPALQDYLSQSGYTEPKIRQLIEAQLYEEKLRQAIGEELPAVQEQIHARHLVFKSQDEASAALQRLQNGASFEELAASQSTDTATKDKGGDLGWLPRLGRDLAFDDALFALQPGQTSGVVQTDNGYEIIQALEVDPARPVDASLLDEMRRRHFGDWLAQAEGSPEIDRQLTPDKSDWILQHAGGKRS